MKWKIRDIVKETGGKLIQGSEEVVVRGISTDTRSVKRGDLLVALKGGRFDGHDYLKAAFKRGVAGVVVQKMSDRSDLSDRSDRPIIQVPDTLQALGDLAAAWRRRFSVRLVAVTGSNGKTSTKEMIASVLSTRYRVLKTEGNLNNLIGLPLTLFRLNHRHQAAVVEMGMNRPGEIRRLAQIAAPEIGVITNIGHAHLEGLRSLSGVARAKGELLQELPKLGLADRAGLAVLNRETPFFERLKKLSRARVISVGWSKGSTLRCLSSEALNLRKSRFCIAWKGKKKHFYLPAPGRHNVENALSAIAVGLSCGLSFRKIQRGLRRYRTPASRMQTIRTPRWTILNDSYNANPDSTSKALEFLGSASIRGRKVAILGEMLELGRYARKGHESVGEKAVGVDELVAIGPHASSVKKGFLRLGRDPQDVTTGRVWKPSMRSRLRKGDLILVKGSRGMKMEKIVEELKN